MEQKDLVVAKSSILPLVVGRAWCELRVPGPSSFLTVLVNCWPLDTGCSPRLDRPFWQVNLQVLVVGCHPGCGIPVAEKVLGERGVLGIGEGNREHDFATDQLWLHAHHWNEVGDVELGKDGPNVLGGELRMPSCDDK